MVEVAGSGHVDPLALVLLCGALYWLGRGACRLAGAALGAAFLAKLLPAMALPLLWRECRRRAAAGSGEPPQLLSRLSLRPLLWFGAVALAGYGLYAGADIDLFTALRTYALKWRFNEAAYSLVHGALHRVGGLSNDSALYAARWLCAIAFLAVAVRVLKRCDDPAWISLSGLVFLAYWVLDGYRSAGVWEESAWVKWAEYTPFFAILALTWWRQRRRGP